MTPLLLAAAGTAAGIIGTAGGITSLVSYPALLAAGLSAVPADMANVVALVACWPGAAIASRQELKGQGRWVLIFGGAAVAGGAAGSVLLMVTPAHAFAYVVPFLVAAGSIALLLQPKIASLAGDRRDAHRFLLGIGTAAVSTYNGYFGAGAGVMTLALIMIGEANLPRANALKNMVVGAAAIASASSFVLVRPIPWSVVVPLGIGLFCGSTMGPGVARRLPSRVVRLAAALLGFGLAIQLGATTF